MEFYWLKEIESTELQVRATFNSYRQFFHSDYVYNSLKDVAYNKSFLNQNESLKDSAIFLNKYFAQLFKNSRKYFETFRPSFMSSGDSK